MKQETNKKNKKWLWLVIGLAALLVVAGTVLALVLGGGQEEKAPGGRPELYWNVDKDVYTQSDETGISLSTREPAEDGLYHMRFAYEGQVQEYTVADKRLVNFIDTFDCVGLVFDRDGSVVDAVDARDVATEVGKEVYVRYYRNDTLYVNTSIAMNGMTLMLDVTDLTRVYDVSANSQNLGGEISAEDLQPMDCVTIYGNELEQSTHVYLQEKPEKSPVYWRVQAQYDSAIQGTARIPDETGAYSMDFFCDGEIVTLKCRDKKIVDYVDYKSDYKAHFGFVFDEEGYIVKRIGSEIGIQARYVGEGYDVTYIEENEIELTSQIWSNAGDVEGFKVEDDTVIYDVSKAAFAEGRQGKPVESLQLGDRVVVWLDTENDAVLVYVTERLVDSPMYYNVTRKYSASRKESTREPNSEGWYEVELAVGGEVKTFKTRDKAKIDYLDSFSPRGLGLKVINGNEIEYVYHANCIYGQKYYCDGRYVMKVTGSVLELWSRPQDTLYNAILDPECEVYDLSGVGELGSKTTLQAGDNVLAYRKPTGELTCIYVMRRACEDADFYWNLTRKYDATTKQTTRQPDAEGWYVFTMAMGGKTVTVKTKSKALATKVDAFSPGAVGMIVENGIIQAAFDSRNVYGGNQLTSGTYVSAINSDGTAQTYSLKNDKYTDFTIAEDCKIYNISAAYIKEKGEPTTLKLGDMVTVYANIKNEAAIIIVRNREVDNMYWKQDRFYDSTNKVTTRVPDAEGWYVYNLAVNGEVKTFKTKDVEIASKVDATESGFTLLLNGDEIVRYVSASYTRDVKGDGLINWDVVSVSGNQVTVRYNRPGSENTGKTQTITLASGAKIMDVSPTAEKFGAYVKLQPGDRIRSYVDTEDDHLYVWVKYRATREKGVESLCEHCGETVFWNPYVGGGVPKGDGHYYLVQDTVTTSQTTIGADELDYEVVIDLNGKTLTRENGRALLAYKGEKLTVMDSVGGGEVRATGSSSGHGGVLLVSGGGTFTLMGGTLRAIEGDSRPAYGGIVAVSGKGTVFNMTGGKLADGVTVGNEKYSARGGSIYCAAATVNLSGGAVEGGSAKLGGSIYLAADAVANITGGTVSGGVAKEYGGSVYVSTNAALNVSGGKIAGGSAKYGANVAVIAGALHLSGGELAEGAAKLYGGNVYANDGSAVTVSGGKISGGTAGDYAGNIYLTTKGACTLDISGGEILGDVRLNGAGKVTVSGAPKIGVGSEGGLDMRNGTVLNIGQLKAGAKIAISRTGAFSAYNEKAADYIEYFRTAKEGGSIYEQEGILYAAAGQIKSAYCDHCKSEVTWHAWSHENATALVSLKENGHYFLEDSVDMTVQTNIGTSSDKAAGITVDVVLDLNGKTWTSTKRALSVYGKLTLIDSVGGGIISATGNGNGGVIFVPGGTVDMYGGTIESVAQDMTKIGQGGNVYLGSKGIFNMYGGAISNGRTDQEGGNVYVSNATFNLIAGLISGGNGINGGNIYVTDGTLKLTGGSVEGGYASSGGSLYLKDTTFEMSGGTITGGQAEGNGGNFFSSGATKATITGGGIVGGIVGNSGADYYVNNAAATLTISNAQLGTMRVRSIGSLTVSGVTRIAELRLEEGEKLTIGEMEAGTEIGVVATGVFSETNENAETYLKNGYFISVPADQTIAVADNVLYAEYAPEGAVKRRCDHCNQDVYWLAWDHEKGISLNDAAGTFHYFLETDYIGQQTEQIALKNGVELVLDLQGKTYEAVNTRIFHISGGSALTVMDSGEKGIMRSAGTGGKSGGILFATGATVKLMDGTLEAVKNETPVTTGGVLYLSSNSVFTMEGGTITGGLTSGDGGNIYADASSITITEGVIENGVSGNRGGNILIGANCDFTMSGGTVSGGQAAKQGGNIRLNYSSTDVTVSGGTIMGDMTVYSAKSFTLSGSPKILMGNSAGLILGDGIDPSTGNAGLKLTLDGLNPDAEIYISAVGDITDAPAADLLNCFKGALRTTVTADPETGVLKAEQGDTGFCPHCWKTGTPAVWTDAATIPGNSGSFTKLSENAHYYLTNNITRSGSGSRLNIGGTSSTDVDIVIDLAGYNWTVTNNRVAQVFAQLTVMDSLCKGVMSGATKGTAEPYSSVITVNHNNASLTLYSGTLKSDVTDAAVVNANKGVFHQYGGSVVGPENATVDSVIVGAAGTFDRQGGLVDGEPKKEEITDNT